MKRAKTILALLVVVSVMVPQYAAQALGETKDPRAVEPLIAALKDHIKDVRRRAAEALRNIAGKDFGKDPAKWQEWWEKNK